MFLSASLSLGCVSSKGVMDGSGEGPPRTPVENSLTWFMDSSTSNL